MLFIFLTGMDKVAAVINENKVAADKLILITLKLNGWLCSFANIIEGRPN